MSLGKSSLWVFCLGSGPFFVFVSGLLLFVSLSPLAKRKSGWGICGSSWFGGFCVFGCFLFTSICLLLWTIDVLVPTSFRLLMLM